MISPHRQGGGGSKSITVVTSALDVAAMGGNILKVHFNEGVTVTKIIAQVIDDDLTGGGGP